jgi:hypothetical protein
VAGVEFDATDRGAGILAGGVLTVATRFSAGAIHEVFE